MTVNTELLSAVLSQCIENVVGADDYSQSLVNKWTASIVERCLTQLVKQGKPYKYIGTFWAGLFLCETTVISVVWVQISSM